MKTGLPSIFKNPGHKTYEYKPRYWDEKKERKAELERLVTEARSGEITDDRRAEKLRQQLEFKWGGKRTVRTSGANGQSLRLLVILGMLGLLVWLFLNWG